MSISAPSIHTSAFSNGGQLSRFSSRHGKLAQVYLKDRISGAATYDRIAGYFRSSIFELVGEEIETVGKIRVVANADLDLEDIRAAQKIREAAIFSSFVDTDKPLDATLHRGRYAKLYALLTSGRLEVRVVAAQTAPFLHGKAGVIRRPSGEALCFMGSINETRSAWAHNYELVWEDSSADGVDWVQAEFDELWRQAVPLPDLVIQEIGRLAKRHEVQVEVLAPEAVGPAALVESPLYRTGESLAPWQRAFVSIFLQHRATYGAARLLLADEVGVGKTLSLAASALVSALLGDGAVLILVPSTLAEQWQIELKDRLGIPSARWHSSRKHWIDAEGRAIRGRGAPDVARCPFAIGIVSTGLIVQGFDQHGRPKHGGEAAALLSCRFGTVILDEAHKARGGAPAGASARQDNNLLAFTRLIATRTRHLLLSTATPVQTSVEDLWDLLKALGQGSDYVVGDAWSDWRHPDRVLPILTGERAVLDLNEGWRLLANPIPPDSTDAVIANLRDRLGIPKGEWRTTKTTADIDNPILRSRLEALVASKSNGLTWFQRHNPLVRHIVLRKRRDLEDRNLIPRLPVDVHPVQSQADADLLPRHIFDGLSVATSEAFREAYGAANSFTDAYRKRQRAAKFVQTLLLRRICSSFAAGLATARTLIESRPLDDEEVELELGTDHVDVVQEERRHLEALVAALEHASDPKLAAVKYFLDERKGPDGRSWAQMGCIIFSQYYDTADWFARSLSLHYPDLPLGLYAGAGKSKLYLNGEPTSVQRDQIKVLVRRRELKIVVATDAACEGLNLQTLGTLINIDLPWNPSRLEQRIGRIKRFGQTRERVDMANLSYAGTIDEKVYRVLSERLQTMHDLLGTLPETIDDEWIRDVETLEERLRDYTNPRERADPFKQQYGNALVEEDDHWVRAQEVLSRQDLEAALSRGWRD